MAVRAFPFEGQEADEGDYYRRWYRESRTLNGLALSFGQAFSPLGFSLSTGDMLVGGATLLVEDAPYVSQSASNTATQPVRDMLVGRRTLLPGGGSGAELVVKRGAPAASPVDPALTLDPTGVYEEPLWSWQVAANGDPTVTNVRDLRRFGEDASSAADKPPRMFAQPTGPTRVPTNSPIQFGSSLSWRQWDEAKIRVSGSRIRLPQTGFWSLGATVEFANNQVGHRSVILRPTGIDIGRGVGVRVDLASQAANPVVSGVGFRTTVHGEIMRTFSAGNELTFEVYQNSGGDLDLVDAYIWARFDGPI